MGGNRRIIVTGGAGYIGSHTIIELLQDPELEVISIDNLSNSSRSTYGRIKSISGRSITTHEIDLCDINALKDVISREGSIDGVIHFAAFKSVPESVQFPLKYYRNNIETLLNILEVIQENVIPTLIFSSSCSVYGDIQDLPVSETTTLGEARSPYAYTKQIGERIVQDHTASRNDLKAISLRYFNPVGAHLSGQLGEDPINPPTSLVPIIARSATGRIKEMTVHGTDYATRDGSCIRDYVHVCDIARAHVQALEYARSERMSSAHEIINLGTGNGVSVLEAIQAFERVTGEKLPYKIGPRREGDVGAVYSDTRRSSQLLGWKAIHDIDTMMASAYAWEQRLITGSLPNRADQ